MMWKKIKSYFSMLHEYRVMMKGSKFFEKNPVVQGRFEENEDWLEHLEDRVYTLEKMIGDGSSSPSPKNQD